MKKQSQFTQRTGVLDTDKFPGRRIGAPLSEANSEWSAVDLKSYFGGLTPAQLEKLALSNIPNWFNDRPVPAGLTVNLYGKLWRSRQVVPTGTNPPPDFAEWPAYWELHRAAPDDETAQRLDNFDTSLAGKAPVVHTHPASQITDFAQAVGVLLSQYDQQLKGNVPEAGNTLQKLYSLIVGQFSEVTVATLAARDAYNVPKLPLNIFVQDDGDGRWAYYKALTTGTNAQFIKFSDPDLLGATMSAAAIKQAYESNPDTNAFTDALKAKLEGLTLPVRAVVGYPGSLLTFDPTGSQADNSITAIRSVIMGGYTNYIAGQDSVILGGYQNQTGEQSYSSVVLAGGQGTIKGFSDACAIIGGYRHAILAEITSTGSAIIGGFRNTITDSTQSAIIAGEDGYMSPGCTNSVLLAGSKLTLPTNTTETVAGPRFYALKPGGGLKLTAPNGTQIGELTVANDGSPLWNGQPLGSGGGGAPASPATLIYDVPAAKRSAVVQANAPAVVETDSTYYGKEFYDEVTVPGSITHYRCGQSAQASGSTAWKWFRSVIQ